MFLNDLLLCQVIESPEATCCPWEGSCMFFRLDICGAVVLVGCCLVQVLALGSVELKASLSRSGLTLVMSVSHIAICLIHSTGALVSRSGGIKA